MERGLVFRRGFTSGFLALAVVWACAAARPAQAQDAPGDLASSAAAPTAESASAPTPPTADPLCTGDNVLRGVVATQQGGTGTPARLTDGIWETEGAEYDSVLAFSGSDTLTFELALPAVVGVVQIQADNNDTYIVEGSMDGQTFSTLVILPDVPGAGLRTRANNAASPTQVRWLRVRGAGGDANFGVSEISASCRVPPQGLRRVAPAAPSAQVQGPAGLDLATVDVVKGLWALGGAVFFLWAVALARAGRPELDALFRRRMLVALGVGGFVLYFNVFKFHFDKVEHTWEHYHYYIGSKYAWELEYDGIYACAIAADADAGTLGQPNRRVRDLHTNVLKTVDDVKADAAACKARFSSARWKEYMADVAWFRSAMGSSRWATAQHDHGYNGTPVWGLISGALSNMTEASATTERNLALVDPVLLLILWVAIWRAFGIEAACVALLFWGTNHPARYFWVGGGYLRQDWLLCLGLGLCAAKREKMALSGFLLTASAFLRIFPGFIVVGYGLVLAWRCVKARKFVLDVAARRFIMGCVIAVVALGGVSSAVFGPSSWGGFVTNSRKHLKTPLTNNMGLKTVIAYSPETTGRRMHDPRASDPYGVWKETRVRLGSERMWLFALCIVGFCALYVRAMAGRPPWEILAAGCMLIPIFAELTCYYYSFLSFVGLLWLRPGPGTQGIMNGRVGVGLWICGMSAATTLVYKSIGWYDEQYTAMSAVVLLFLYGLVAVWAFRKPEPGATIAG